MGLLRSVGTSVGHGVQKRTVGRLAAPLIFGAVGLGVARGLSEKGSPWRENILPDAQNTLFGSSTAVQDSLSASILTNIAGYNDKDVLLPPTYAYGAPIGTGRAANPVDGSMVFGMWNLRR